MQVYIPNNMDSMKPANISTRNYTFEANITVSNNHFENIYLTQATVSTQTFRGGLFTLYSDSSNARLSFMQNTVLNCHIHGEKAALIAV